MTTICKDCGIQGLGVHHCEAMSDQEWCAHGIALNCKDCRIEALEISEETDRKVILRQQDRIEELETVVNCHICVPRPGLCSKHQLAALKKDDE